MNPLGALIGAFYKEWKTTATDITYVVQLFGIGVRSAAIAWIALQTRNPALVDYIFIGAPFAAIFFGIVHRVGWSLSSELSGRSLDFSLISRAHMYVVLLGKTLAHLVYGIPSGVIAFVAVWLVAFRLPVVADIGLLVVSILFVFFGLVATSIFFAPLMVLVGARGGFTHAILPFGSVLSGFILPVAKLPQALEVLARCLPGSWAMESVWRSLQGTDAFWQVLTGWGMCILVSAIWFSVTYYMYNVVEKRIRITGILGAY